MSVEYGVVLNGKHLYPMDYSIMTYVHAASRNRVIEVRLTDQAVFTAIGGGNEDDFDIELLIHERHRRDESVRDSAEG